HHGYQRAGELINRQASSGPSGSPVFARAGKTEPPSHLIISQTSAGIGRRFGSTDTGLTEAVSSAAELALECIGNSDALYHNVEHTMLVTLAGYDIMRGRALLTQTDASDFVHLITACLFHDIGYVRGILKGDGPDGYVIDAEGGKTQLPRGASDA